jgi:hypothetical protein
MNPERGRKHYLLTVGHRALRDSCITHFPAEFLLLPPKLRHTLQEKKEDCAAQW